jgi:hypothetical protein
MSRTISQDTRTAITAPQTDKVFLLMLEISSSELVSTLYFVQNNEIITSNSNDYIPVNFSATIPTEEDGKVQDTSISISGINRQVIEAIRSVTDAVDVTMFVIRSDDPDTIEVGPWNFKLRSVTYNVNSVSGSLKYENSLNNNISTIRVTNQTFPGVYG